ncbi:MAG: hypothetical protein CMA34_01115 [Euryarchaeota archaeon]|nr:hypothetical protein [Euryarchaeota archaeon]|tara:strand:- start:215 stop:1075 length:861 start_codon:yes stop_codon:yes gene_type:complete
MVWWYWVLIILGIFLTSLPISMWYIKVAPRKPSNEGDWVSDNAKTASVTVDGRVIKMRNVRDFTWRSSKDHDIKWNEEEYHLDDLIGLYYIVEYIHKFRALAHTMITFEFKNDRFLTCSFEVRRKKGQKFHPWTGLWRSFTLIQIWATEHDLLWLRTNLRKNETYLLPCATLPEKREAMLLQLCKRTNQLAEKPEFYHTLAKSCTTSLIREANIVTPGKIPFSLGEIMPGYSIKPAIKFGVVQDLGGYEKTKELSRIDQLASKLESQEGYSIEIRKNMKGKFEHPK